MYVYIHIYIYIYIYIICIYNIHKPETLARTMQVCHECDRVLQAIMIHVTLQNRQLILQYYYL